MNLGIILSGLVGLYLCWAIFCTVTGRNIWGKKK